MDLSKLPKLSQTPQPPSEPAVPPVPPPPAQPVVAADIRAPLMAPRLAEAWFSIAIGLIVLFVFPHTFQYLHNPAAFQQNNPVNDAQGNPLPYAHSEFFWSDMGMAVFGVVLLIEGIALLVALRRPVILAVFFLTAAAGLLNLYVVIRTYNVIGFQLFCAVAVAISGYMALSQWSIAQVLGRVKK